MEFTKEEIEIIIGWFDDLGFNRGFDLFDQEDIDLKIKMAKHLKALKGN